MSMQITFFDQEFNRAIDELSIGSRRTDVEVLIGQAIQLLRAIVRRTRLTFIRLLRNRGRARAGWWPAWKQLGVFGVPGGTSSRTLNAAEGSFVDGRNDRNNPFFEMINEVPYIDKLEQEDQTLLGAGQERFDDMQDTLDRRYGKLMRRHSATR